MFNNNSRAHGAIGALFAGAKSPREKNSIAQGTIEYLVVIAVIVVISLIVVALVINVSSSPSQQVLDSSDKLGNVAVGGISIVEAVSDLDGESLIMLSNNSSEGITLKKITVGENDNNYDDYIGGVDSVPISLTGLASSCPCESGQKSVKCEFVFEYLTKSGLTQIERRTINVQCTNSNNNPTPSNPNRVIEPIDVTPPEVILFSPTSSESRSVDFNFSVSDDSEISSCTLFIGEDSNTYNDISSGLNIITYEFSMDKLVDWNISCTDSLNNIGYSVSLNLNVDSNKYQIKTCLELQDMNDDLTGNYELMNDIDCEADTNNSSGALWNNGAGFEPIGFDYDNSFSGNFDGQNYTISNLFINNISRESAGLFGTCQGKIKNVGLINVSITGNYDVGGLVGRDYASITNSFVTGNINGYQNVGGLVGFSQDQIINSNFIGNVAGTGTYNVGGLVGINYGGSIFNSNSTGVVNGVGSLVGGLVGENMGTIFNSYSTASVSGLSYVGGLVGDLGSGLIENSYSIGSVTGSASAVGGLVGYQYSGSIINSYSTGSIWGDSSVGGLVGYTIDSDLFDPSTISNSYSTGAVTGSTQIGGLVGVSEGSIISNSYWDVNTSEQLISAGGTGKTTAEMKSMITYDGWDFIDIWNISDSYPFLR